MLYLAGVIKVDGTYDQHDFSDYRTTVEYFKALCRLVVSEQELTTLFSLLDTQAAKEGDEVVENLHRKLMKGIEELHTRLKLQESDEQKGRAITEVVVAMVLEIGGEFYDRSGVLAQRTEVASNPAEEEQIYESVG